MSHGRYLLALPLVMLLTAAVAAQEKSLALQSAHGTVDKVEKDTLTIRPRGAEGKFAKSLTLRITGTSRVTTLSQQVRSKKAVYVQRDTDPKDLENGQAIAVIYTAGTGGPVLLVAVAQSAGGK